MATTLKQCQCECISVITRTVLAVSHSEVLFLFLLAFVGGYYNWTTVASRPEVSTDLNTNRKSYVASLAQSALCNITCGSRSFTIRYDTRCYFNVRSKADISQLNPVHGTNN